ncbi:MAG TPA: hypothetical protein VD947_00810 [Patescibacteria group bacterium]|nr:hypothetical protein [Patescibacteria group bacterium]
MNILINTAQIKRIIFSIIFALGLFSPVLVSGTAEAANVFSGAKEEACKGVRLESGPADCSGGAEATSKIITRVINLISAIVGIICVIVIIISGFRFVTSGGDSNGITSARNTFIYALVGLIIVAFAQLIVKVVLTRIS